MAWLKEVIRALGLLHAEKSDDGYIGGHIKLKEQPTMDWKVILVVIGFCVGGWWLGQLMTGSGRNNDDGGGG